MLDPLANSTLPVLEQVVRFTQARHGVLAGNIANLNTPGYKSRDLSPQAFRENLRTAIDSSRRARSPGDAVVLGPLAGDNEEGLMTLGSLGGDGDLASTPSLKESMTSLVYHDLRDVSLESQVTEISKNQSLHNLALTLMSAQFRQMRSAISETVA
jgi:flagellar basal-body rod protein FlgB